MIAFFSLNVIWIYFVVRDVYAHFVGNNTIKGANDDRNVISSLFVCIFILRLLLPMFVSIAI